MVAKHLIISKPRKGENSYVSQLYYREKQTPFTHTFQHAKVMAIRPLQQRDEFMIYLRCKTSHEFMCDVNAEIIDTVKDNNSSWFHTNMNVELVEDYYSSTFVYDKQHGDLIRLKCIGDESVLQTYLEQVVDLTVTFMNLRFYKQKFVAEVCVTEVNPVPSQLLVVDDQEVSEEGEEDPEPNADDVFRIKDECLTAISDKIGDLTSQVAALSSEIGILEQHMKLLQNTTDLTKITEICDSCWQ